MSKTPDFVITNMVASASLGLELDLYMLATKIKDLEYEPEQFPGAILKFKEPKASLLLFKNGKVVCVKGENHFNAKEEEMEEEKEKDSDKRGKNPNKKDKDESNQDF